MEIEKQPDKIYGTLRSTQETIISSTRTEQRCHTQSQAKKTIEHASTSFSSLAEYLNDNEAPDQTEANALHCMQYVRACRKCAMIVPQFSMFHASGRPRECLGPKQQSTANGPICELDRSQIYKITSILQTMAFESLSSASSPSLVSIELPTCLKLGKV